MKLFSFKLANLVILFLISALLWLIFYSPAKNIFIPGASVRSGSTNSATAPKISSSAAPLSDNVKNIIQVSPEVSPALSPVPEILPEKDVFLDVPFTSQAPFGNWKDPKQQDACEEASALMAMAWARREELTPQKSLKAILAIVDYEEANYGNYHDTDAEDTADIIFRGYLEYDNIEVRHQIGAEDIKRELFKGNLVVVPANGRKLGNSRYTQPGPLEHNLVVRGYDVRKKEFITNDPGILYGENYRYKEKVLEAALSDYPTGYHEPIISEKTAMIIIRR